jgi:site-specific DNA recombinase
MHSANGHGPKRAVLYARVSTEEQAEEGYSLPEQVRDLERYAAANGYAVLGDPIEDDGYSGRTMNRPGLARVRELAEDGAFDVLLVAKWNRLFRRGAYQDLFVAEMKLAGVDVVSLDGQKNDTAAGRLFNRMMADFSEYQRDDLLETMQRGKRGRARAGKVVPGRYVPYGFDYDRDAGTYVVNEPRMSVVRSVFRMVGGEGWSLYGVAKALRERGAPTPADVLAAREGKTPPGNPWRHRALRLMIQNDVYKPHDREELAALVSPEVAARLDPERRYGVQWYNRARYEQTPDGEKAVHVTPNKREEWIAVPVPDAGVPRELVEAAREAIEDNPRPSANDARLWELSGGILFCGHCGNRMAVHSTRAGARRYHYYHCPKRRRSGVVECRHGKHHRAEELEAAVWAAISDYLKGPGRLRADLERAVEIMRQETRGDPAREVRAWAERLAEVDRKRSGYLDLAAEGIMVRDELRAKLAALDETRAAAERELAAVRDRAERLEEFEREAEAVLEFYARLTPKALDALAPEERQQFYRVLGLRVTAHQDAPPEIDGIFVVDGPLGMPEPLRDLDTASRPRPRADPRDRRGQGLHHPRRRRVREAARARSQPRTPRDIIPRGRGWALEGADRQS